jgi:predicted MPP superfamily phosphohydrolase
MRHSLVGLFFLAVYVLVNVVICLRLRSLFTERSRRRIVVLSCTLLALAFPAAELLSHASGAAWAEPVAFLGSFALPFLLYLFLAVLLFDAFLLLRRLLKIPRGPRFRWIGLSVLLAVPLIVIIAGWVHHGRIKVNAYRVEVPAKASTIDRLRVVMAADFHLRRSTPAALMPRFVEMVNALHPDIVLIPGDVLEGDRQDESTAEIERQLRRLEAKYGVWASYGNHEHHGGKGREAFFSKSGIHTLRDEVVKIDQAFYLAGRKDSHDGGRKDIGDLLSQATEPLPIIVLDHRPSDLENVGRSKADIQVSGHTHGGQLWPLNVVSWWLYGLSRGTRKVGRTHVFVTSGLQVWSAPVRTAGDSEIMLIDVVFVKNVK